MSIEEVKAELDRVREQIKLHPHNMALAYRAHRLKARLYSLSYGGS